MRPVSGMWSATAPCPRRASQRAHARPPRTFTIRLRRLKKGYVRGNKTLPRTALDMAAIGRETSELIRQGHKRILLVAGEGYSAANGGFQYVLDAIASVVIGGTLLSGGVGTVLGTLFGVAIQGLI